MPEKSVNTHTRGRIVVLGTGGTIAGTAASSADNIGYTAAQVGVAQLLGAIPALRNTGWHIETEQIAQIDSKDMEFSVWQMLAPRVAHWLALEDVAGVVITHGTDTLEETAYFLQAVLDPSKPVVLTCAMRPASSAAPDGPQNVMDAVAVAGSRGARGVVAVCAGVVHSAFDVQKTHPYRLDPFSSGDAGPVAYVEEGTVRRLRAWPAGQLWQQGAGVTETLAPFVPSTSALQRKWLNGAGSLEVEAFPRVEIVLSHAGAGGGVVQALVAQGVRGLIVAATGNGTVHHRLEAALLAAMSAGIPVWRATRCGNGRILPVPDASIPDAGGLSPVKARLAMMLVLSGAA